MHPTVFATKALLKISHKEHGVALFSDLHGHSRKKNIFMYGCVAPTAEKNGHKTNAQIKAFPFLLTQQHRYASFKDCTFACERDKESTARIVVFKEVGIQNAYTLEASFYGSDHKY